MTEYKITERDYVDASYFALKKSRLIMYAIVLLAPLLIPLMAGFSTGNLRILAIVYAAVILFLLFLERPIVRFFLRRIYRKNPIYHKSQEVSVTDEEILLRSTNGSASYRPEELEKIDFNKGIWLIYPASTFYHIIPERILTDEEIQVLKAHAS